MTTSTQPPVIVIKRVRKAGHAHHGGAWKVAYADFVTAMMALFLVLWLMASDEKVKKAVGGYFQDPTGQGKLTGTNTAGAGGEGLAVAKDDLKNLKDKIEKAMKQLPKFEQMKKNVQITVTTEGLRIELLENEKGMFFDSGNAQPTENGREMVKMLADQLKALPNKLLIEGHTDAKPFSNGGDYGNWELSADRANSARRILLQGGLDADHVAQVRGFADQRLRDPKDPLNAANRRISVIVQYMDTPADGAKGHPAE
jgi:chemotaxis protein MotB